MGNVHQLRLPASDVTKLIAEMALRHQNTPFEYVLAMVVDSEGDLWMLSAGDTTPAQVTYVLGATLTQLHMEALDVVEVNGK